MSGPLGGSVLQIGCAGFADTSDASEISSTAACNGIEIRCRHPCAAFPAGPAGPKLHSDETIKESRNAFSRNHLSKFCDRLLCRLVPNADSSNTKTNACFTVSDLAVPNDRHKSMCPFVTSEALNLSSERAGMRKIGHTCPATAVEIAPL